jgi:hypothetical protein
VKDNTETLIELQQEAILAAEQRGYLRGLHDAWYNTHIRRFNRHGGPWVEGSSPGAVDRYYSGVVASGNIIGDLWNKAGQPGHIGSNTEFPVTELNDEKKAVPTD